MRRELHYDAVVIGAGNLRATPGHQWTAAAVAGDDAPAIEAFRFERTGATEPAVLVVVSASGDLPAHVALDSPATSVAVVTSAEGAVKVHAGHPRVTVIEAGEEDGISGAGVVAAGAAHAGAPLAVTAAPAKQSVRPVLMKSVSKASQSPIAARPI